MWVQVGGRLYKYKATFLIGITNRQNPNQGWRGGCGRITLNFNFNVIAYYPIIFYMVLRCVCGRGSTPSIFSFLSWCQVITFSVARKRRPLPMLRAWGRLVKSYQKAYILVHVFIFRTGVENNWGGGYMFVV